VYLLSVSADICYIISLGMMISTVKLVIEADEDEVLKFLITIYLS
jgi:hypothetical protein